MASQSIDLGQLFGTVAQTLTQNQTSLNASDTYNHDHGDNMVQIFEVITQAMKEKSKAAPADQLAYASQLLRSKSQSGSAKIYADGLSDASSKFAGKKSVTPNSAMTLIQALLGAQKKIPVEAVAPSQAPTDGGDLLGSLLGGLTGATSGSSAQSSGGGDLLGSLLGGLTGAAPASSSSKSGKIDIATLLKAGMTYAQSKGAGDSNLEAIMNAVMSTSRMSDSGYRSQSGALVANTLLQALSQMKSR